MAYIVRDEDTSMALPAGENFRSFLVSGGEPNLMAPPSNSFSFVKRNLLSEIHRLFSLNGIFASRIITIFVDFIMNTWPYLIGPFTWLTPLGSFSVIF